MKCKNCGTEFNEGIFCPECGTKNEPMTNENTVVENTITMETRNEEENNNNAVKVVSVANGNLIVNIKDSRIAIGKDMAARIMV